MEIKVGRICISYREDISGIQIAIRVDRMIRQFWNIEHPTRTRIVESFRSTMLPWLDVPGKVWVG